MIYIKIYDCFEFFIYSQPNNYLQKLFVSLKNFDEFTKYNKKSILNMEENEFEYWLNK